MSADSSIHHFVGTVAADVRLMPLCDARTYLRGLLVLVGEGVAIEPLREIYRSLDAADNQLELIACGQLKLNFEEGGAQ